MGFTLLRHAPTGPELYMRILGQSGHPVTAEELQAAVLPAREFYVRASRDGRQFEASMDLAIEFWAEYNALILDNLGLPAEDHTEIGRRIYTEAWSPQAWQLYPDTIPTLKELCHRGVRMAVISNFVDTLQAVCEHHGLAPYFDVILPSVDAGAMKPDPSIFAKALRRLGVAPGDAWHVGDNYWADILGARAAGLTAILVDRERSVHHPDGPVVHRLDQLPELLSEAEEVAA
jgi:putative hydrolase of the HAD superfamily